MKSASTKAAVIRQGYPTPVEISFETAKCLHLGDVMMLEGRAYIVRSRHWTCKPDTLLNQSIKDAHLTIHLRMATGDEL